MGLWRVGGPGEGRREIEKRQKETGETSNQPQMVFFPERVLS